MTPRLKLSFELTEWVDEDFNSFHDARRKFALLAKNSGQQSPKFKIALKKLLRAARSGDQDEIPRTILTRTDVRAFTTLLEQNDEFCSLIEVNPSLFDALEGPSRRLGLVSLFQLIRTFFARYNEVGSNEELHLLSEFIKQQLRFHSSKGSLRKLTDYKNDFFCNKAHEKFVKKVISKEMELTSAFRSFGLESYEGRFKQACQHQFYLEKLKLLGIGEDHSILAEICQPRVFDALWTESELLGHEILKILIDRASPSEISDSWQNVILQIAGDPRVAATNQRYAKWWAILGEDRVVKVKAWLSRLDLKLFLSALAQSAKDENNSDMQRMFHSRKKFMEGLLELELVEESRLFLGYAAEHHINSYYKKTDLPSFAQVQSDQTSVIYLKVAGFHMIEGTHNFRIKVFDKLPSRSGLTNYSRNIFSDAELRSGVVINYRKESEISKRRLNYLEESHVRNWQRKVLNFFRKNRVKIVAHKVLDEKTYREIKYRYGLN